MTGPGTELVVDEASGLRAVIAIDRFVDGRAAGGIRIRAYPDDDAAHAEAEALARAMSKKSALAGIRSGGAKVVVRADALVDRGAALGALGRRIEAFAGALYVGPDFGFTDEDRASVAAATRYIDDPQVAAGLADATARGVREALAAAMGVTRLDGARVAIQGLGKVGGALAWLLQGEGARVSAHEIAARSIEGVERIDARALWEGRWDAIAPCALGGVIDRARADGLACRALVGAANELLVPPEEEVAARLMQRGVIHVPDFVANAGALIHWGTLVVERGSLADAEARVRRIGETTRGILDRARAEGRTPWAIACSMI